MSGLLSEKVCIVTGTGGSMGHAAALTFAREGALLVGCDVTVEPAEETLEAVRAAGGQIASLQPCRLSDPVDCAKLVELAVSEFGRIAASPPPMRPHPEQENARQFRRR
jgi:NAD(P)-dependent dehydrogenase (short-subunit alcohol dehydrogenase family)